MASTPAQIRILDRVLPMFLREGVRSVTMDDVAASLKISKKTLYKHFANKRDLVALAVRRHCREERRRVEAVRRGSEDAIDEMLRIGRLVTEQLGALNPDLVADIRRFFPEAWKAFLDYKTGFVHRCLAENLRRGVAEGLYRPDLDTDLIARLYVGRMDLCFDAELFPPGTASPDRVFAEFLTWHIRGVASAQGVHVLENRLYPPPHAQTG